MHTFIYMNIRICIHHKRAYLIFFIYCTKYRDDELVSPQIPQVHKKISIYFGFFFIFFFIQAAPSCSQLLLLLLISQRLRQLSSLWFYTRATAAELCWTGEWREEQLGRGGCVGGFMQIKQVRCQNNKRLALLLRLLLLSIFAFNYLFASIYLQQFINYR